MKGQCEPFCMPAGTVKKYATSCAHCDNFIVSFEAISYTTDRPWYVVVDNFKLVLVLACLCDIHVLHVQAQNLKKTYACCQNFSQLHLGSAWYGDKLYTLNPFNLVSSSGQSRGNRLHEKFELHEVDLR